jgi:hypothetical protein
MAENNFVPPTEALSEPELRRTNSDPKGVLQKNLKIFVYLGAALLVIAAALFSSTSKKTPAQQAAAKGQPPQPTLQDNTDNNVQDLKNQLSSNSQQPRLLQTEILRSRLRHPRNVPPPQPMGRPAFRRHVFPANLAHNPPTVRRVMVNRAMRSLNSRRNSSRHSSSLQRSGSEPTSHASPRILCMPAPWSSHNKRRARSRLTSSPLPILARRYPAFSRSEPQGKRKMLPMATNVPWRPILIQQKGSLIWSTRDQFSTQY